MRVILRHQVKVGARVKPHRKHATIRATSAFVLVSRANRHQAKTLEKEKTTAAHANPRSVLGAYGSGHSG